MNTEYQTTAEPRAMIGDVPVFCSHDEILTLEKINPNPQNPNVHPDKQLQLLARFIKERGWRAPITISTRSGFIVRGHGRLMAARLIGAKSAPVEYQNYESSEAEISDMIADNKIAELSDLDDEMVAELLKDFDEDSLFMELTGYDIEEIDRIFAESDKEKTYATDSPQYIPTLTPAEQPQYFTPEPPIYVNPSDVYARPYEEEIQRKQSQTGEIDLNEYAEDRYSNECPKCKFKW